MYLGQFILTGPTRLGQTELNLKSDDPLLTVTFSYSRTSERNRSNDFFGAEKAIVLKFFYNARA